MWVYQDLTELMDSLVQLVLREWQDRQDNLVLAALLVL